MENRDKLLDRIYVTRKCRIVSAENFLKTDSFISAVNIYYSAILLVFSICTLTNGNHFTNIALVSASILVFAFNTFIYSQNFKDKYLSYKENYIALDQLFWSIKSNTKDYTEMEIIYNDKYTELLSRCPNHKTIDFYIVLINDKELLDKKNYTVKKIVWIYICYILFYIRNFIGSMLIIIAPFGIPFLIQLISNMFMVLGN